MPAVWVSRSRIVIARFAGTAGPPGVVTVVLANPGMKRPAGSLRPICPSSINDRIATLVNAFVCDAMRKIVSVAMRRPASLSLQPNARS